jgi:hypothetical protein
MWPQYGVAALSTRSNPPILLMKMAVAGLHRGVDFPSGVLTCRVGSLYTVIRHAAPRCDGASSKPSLIFGDQASDPNRRLRASTALRFSGGWGRLGPGLFDR